MPLNIDMRLDVGADTDYSTLPDLIEHSQSLYLRTNLPDAHVGFTFSASPSSSEYNPDFVTSHQFGAGEDSVPIITHENLDAVAAWANIAPRNAKWLWWGLQNDTSVAAGNAEPTPLDDFLLTQEDRKIRYRRLLGIKADNIGPMVEKLITRELEVIRVGPKKITLLCAAAQAIRSA